ncbi:expressed unknown protein [Seminavis robusta]|uniref:Uncharacterized protein n=1 Tax=Seminavis robusta TaxID=568900 RepID=A0A9N8EHG7_9STRA|nr:expressed unknown protein [Seminavis robusta]|eukprot:Sro1215_g253220.1 n/a (288) ;mRNA; r:23541-24493
MSTINSSPQWFTAAVTSTSSSLYYPLNKEKSMDDSQRSSVSTRRSLVKMVDASPLSTTRASMKSKKRANMRSVKFNDEPEGCVVHQLESDNEDPAVLWFSKPEIQALRAEGRQTLKKVKEAGGDLTALNESIGESIRGLEHGLSSFDSEDAHWNGETQVDRSERRKNIVSTILAQQEEQREMGINDPKGLKQCSIAATQWAHDRALDQAQKDFTDAVEVWREDVQCAKILPSILNRKAAKRASTRRVSLLSTGRDSMGSTAEQRRATLHTISQTVASALEELDDLDF